MQVLVVLVTVFFGVIFTLMNPHPILAAIFNLVPERQHPKAVVIMHRIILPLIMARGMNVHAVAVFFSMLLCVSAFKVLGFLLPHH